MLAAARWLKRRGRPTTAMWCRAGPAFRSDKMFEGEREFLREDCDRRPRRRGQGEAVQAGFSAVWRPAPACAGPEPADRLRFVPGLTGVGKTELTQGTPADYLFDDEHALVRIDMSEFMESTGRLVDWRASRLCRGYEEGGRR